MSLGIGQNEQVAAFQNFWRAQDRMGIQTSATARGVDGFRAGQMQDQVALQRAESVMSSIGEWASNTFGSLFGGSQPDAAAAAPAVADPAPATEAPETAQSAVLDTMKKTGNDLLKRGSSGPEVEALQQMLKAEGYDLGEAGVDGKFGPKTQAAVEAFQRDQAEKAENPDDVSAVDGIVGAKTRASLGNSALARANEVDETVEKLSVGGSRGGPDAIRADKAKKAADMRDTVDKLNAGGPRGGPDAARADKAKASTSVGRAQEADKKAGDGGAAKGGTTV